MKDIYENVFKLHKKYAVIPVADRGHDYWKNLVKEMDDLNMVHNSKFMKAVLIAVFDALKEEYEKTRCQK